MVMGNKFNLRHKGILVEVILVGALGLGWSYTVVIQQVNMN
jgi:hypothetical protein